VVRTAGVVLAALIGAASSASPAKLLLDLDGDGKADTVLLYQNRTTATVVVRFANPSEELQHLTFGVDPNRENALCRLPVHLRAESLDYDIADATGEQIPGFVRSKNGKGFALVDGACDSMHFFWNHRTKRLQWWRL
jgi:hypothetical protein